MLKSLSAAFAALLVAGVRNGGAVTEAAKRELAPTGKAARRDELGQRALYDQGSRHRRATRRRRGPDGRARRRLVVPLRNGRARDTGDVADAAAATPGTSPSSRSLRPRADDHFFPPITEIEASYVVHKDSRSSRPRSDAKGVRIDRAEQAGYELSHANVKSATLVKTTVSRVNRGLQQARRKRSLG